MTIEMRRLGHEAYSCDIQDCSGGHPEWHIKGDALELLKMKWDMLIAFPPCTHLAVSGARHFAKKQADGRQQEAIDFFMRFVNADCPRIAVENPIGIMSSKYRKPNQIIQPYMFGDHARKSTCLWTKGLPPWLLRMLLIREKYARAAFQREQVRTVQGMKTAKSLHGTTHEQQRSEAKPSPASPALWQSNGRVFVNWILRGQSNRDKIVSWNIGRRETASHFSCH